MPGAPLLDRAGPQAIADRPVRRHEAKDKAPLAGHSELLPLVRVKMMEDGHTKGKEGAKKISAVALIKHLASEAGGGNTVSKTELSLFFNLKRCTPNTVDVLKRWVRGIAPRRPDLPRAHVRKPLGAQRMKHQHVRKPEGWRNIGATGFVTSPPMKQLILNMFLLIQAGHMPGLKCMPDHWRRHDKERQWGPPEKTSFVSGMGAHAPLCKQYNTRASNKLHVIIWIATLQLEHNTLQLVRQTSTR